MGCLQQGPHPAGCMESQGPRLPTNPVAAMVGPAQHQLREHWQSCHSHHDSRPRELRALQGSARAISGLFSTARAASKALGLDTDWCWEKPFIAFEILL